MYFTECWDLFFFFIENLHSSLCGHRRVLQQWIYTLGVGVFVFNSERIISKQCNILANCGGNQIEISSAGK